MTVLDAAIAPAATTLLRFATAGNVDDGKSTLVGRLLHDAKAVLADQYDAVESASRRRGQGSVDLALLTDGLRAEREQGITIDVAYRYFATARRRFVMADTPGHVQYTRNMVTGASTADLVLLLVDARKGVTEQTRRHAAVAALLRVPAVVLAVNKMDLVGYDEATFAAIAADFAALAADLGLADVTSIPVAAIDGDNVARPSAVMDWYAGPTVLDVLESVPVGAEPLDTPMRLPVQYVIDADGQRSYAGQLASGVLHDGERVVVLPSGTVTTVAGIDVLGERSPVCWAPQSVAVRLADDVPVRRGDLIVAAGEAPHLRQEVGLIVCQLHERPLRVSDEVLVRHGTRTIAAVVQDIVPAGPIPELTCAPDADSVAVNQIAGVLVRTAEEIAVDRYAEHRLTGACLLIDPVDGTTRAAGVVT
ncbi:sulfate adenylyltransferase subunit 1 [Luedemannella helvata]|uniref:sulfate adenylyltransferase n=1 Tax=Luedemannella helvata TaxID=349315 RepID=A0ABN2JVI6_9ACTN